MNSLSPRACAIINAARPGEKLGADVRKRVRRRLMTATAAVGVGTAVATTGKAAATTKVAASAATSATSIPLVGSVGLLTKIGGSVLLVGAIGVSVQQIASEDVAPPAISGVVSVSRNTVVRVIPTVPTVQPAPVASVVPSEPRKRDELATLTKTGSSSEPQSARVARPTASSIAAETALLNQAQTELQSGNPEKALQLLDRHSHEHTSGALREERQAARVLALCRAGRVKQAGREALRFVTEFPRSPHRGRLMAACSESK